MRNAIILTMFVFILGTGSASADVKIKSKQTMSGQVSENTTYIKGKRQRTESMNGLLVSITQCDLGRDLQLNPNAKAYTVSSFDNGSSGQASPTTERSVSTEQTKGGTVYITTTIKDTGERKQMFGFQARHIIQTVETDSSADACYPTKTKMEMDMWVIDAEFALNCERPKTYGGYSSGRSGGCQDRIVPKTIGNAKSGYPVYQKITNYDANGKESFTMIQEVVELSKATLDASLFEVPQGYSEVSDSSKLYATAASADVDPRSYQNPETGRGYDNSNTNPSLPSSNGFGDTVNKAAEPRTDGPPPVSEKKPGTIRIGMPSVKTGAVGQGVSATDLAAAVQNTLGDFLRGTNIEIVPLEARLAAALANEAKQKECDYVFLANVSHKKGGGGFGSFGKILGAAAPMIPMAGGMAGVVASQVISTAISASSMSGNMKSKDEITLDIKLQATGDNSLALNKQFKAKAKSDGDDIISAVIEQAAQAILNAVPK